MTGNETPVPAVMRRELVVTGDAIDQNRHVNNVVYVQWMQDLAMRHGGMLGPEPVIDGRPANWVAREHHIEYLRPAVEGDTVVAQTWIESMERIRCRRRYEFRRAPDGPVLARGYTTWVLVDSESGRPVKIPDAVRAAFPVAGESPDLSGDPGEG